MELENSMLKFDLYLAHFLFLFLPFKPSFRMTDYFVSVQSLSHVQIYAVPRTAAYQASLSITNSGVYPNSCPSSQ